MKVCSLALIIILHIIFTNPLGADSTSNAPQNEAGFMTIEPVQFYFQYQNYFNRMNLQSSPAKIWYTFLSADHHTGQTPIFVFFNGGPGSATSCGLMSMNTGRYTLDNAIESGGGDEFISNPVPWTQMGHLLYIDARQTGFSYNEMSNASDFNPRFLEFNAQNFNPFFDGADFVRVILRFLKAHPDLEKNPVVIVGESYGGCRATCILYLIYNYRNLADDQEMYQDPALYQEIQEHFNAVFPQYHNQIVPGEMIARQFGHQVLIQPCVSFGYQDEISYLMFRQPGSVIYQIGQEVGIPYNPNQDPLDFVWNTAKRDYYIYTKPANWLNGFFNNAANLLRFSANISKITGTDVKNIAGMYANARFNAYRVIWPEDLIEAGINDSNPLAKHLNGNGQKSGRNADYTPSNLTHNKNQYPLLHSGLKNKSILDYLFRDKFLKQGDAYALKTGYGDLNQIFGTLRSWDTYYLSLNNDANTAFHYWNIAMLRGFEVYYYDHRFGRMFLKNLAHVHTFITNAALDLVVYSPAVPASLARHEDLVTQVRHVTDSPQESRPGEIIVTYANNAFPDISSTGTRIIRFPLYGKSCHAVSLTQPKELFTDVRTWLNKNGIPTAKGEQQ